MVVKTDQNAPTSHQVAFLGKHLVLSDKSKRNLLCDLTIYISQIAVSA
jgi:hypothetical protein